MTDRFYLHVGPHKTGTTYIQGLLINNHERLAAQGVLFPRHNQGKHGRAVRDAVRGGVMPSSGRSVSGEWQKLLDEIRDWPGPTSVISHEMISTATDDVVDTLAHQLGEWDVHVVYAVRDITRVAPAMWQTGLRTRQTVTWSEYARGLKHPDAASGSWGTRFWQSHDAAAVLGRWARHLPVQNLHLMTVPPPGCPPETLWQRFCAVLGVEPAGHDLTPTRSNPSLGTAEAELLRRVNERLTASELDRHAWLSAVRWLGRQLEGRPEAARFSLPDEDFSWMAERSAAMSSALRSAGYPVMGDLDEMTPRSVSPDRGGRHPEDTTEAAVLDVAVAAIHALVARHAAGRARSGKPD